MLADVVLHVRPDSEAAASSDRGGSEEFCVLACSGCAYGRVPSLSNGASLKEAVRQFRMHCRLPFLAELLVVDVRDTPPYLRSAVEPFELQSRSAGVRMHHRR